MNVTNSYNSIYAYSAQASYKTTQASLSVSGSYLDITGDANGKYKTAEGDSVDISDQVKEMVDRIKNLDVFKVIFPDNDVRKPTKSLSEVEGDFMADFNDFSSAFGKMSQMMGLDSNSGLIMGLNGMGGMTVTGSDANSAARVQNAFNQNSTMVSRFAVMAARGSLTDAGDSIPGFKEAYAKDPVAAINDNIDALKERLLGFRTVANGGSMSYGFMRDFELNINASSTTVEYQKAADVTHGSQAGVNDQVKVESDHVKAKDVTHGSKAVSN